MKGRTAVFLGGDFKLYRIKSQYVSRIGERLMRGDPMNCKIFGLYSKSEVSEILKGSRFTSQYQIVDWRIVVNLPGKMRGKIFVEVMNI